MEAVQEICAGFWAASNPFSSRWFCSSLRSPRGGYSLSSCPAGLHGTSLPAIS